MGTTKIDRDHGPPIPPGGALGLLALGYRGLQAWREARGRDWVDERRAEWEAGTAAKAAKKKEAEAAKKAAGADDERSA